MRQQTAHLDNRRSAGFRAAEVAGLIAMLRSDSYRAFAGALAGAALRRKYGLQALAYNAGDYAGPHTDHHPEEPDAERGYFDLHVSFPTQETGDEAGRERGGQYMQEP